MSTAPEGSVPGERVTSESAVEVVPPRRATPEWHSLRLFGRGRHAGVFVSGTETRTDP
jgi:hypothetical protein